MPNAKMGRIYFLEKKLSFPERHGIMEKNMGESTCEKEGFLI